MNKAAGKKSTKKELVRTWRLFDAKGRVLGRLATEIAMSLRGKDQPSFRPHEDHGDVIVVINTDQVRVTGQKATKKLYRWHSGQPGGFKEFSFEQMMERDSRRVIREAVYGMLPKNRLRDRMITHLKLYQGAEHPHTTAPFMEPRTHRGSPGDQVLNGQSHGLHGTRKESDSSSSSS